MAQRLRADVGDQRRHDEFEDAGDQLVRPPGPEVLDGHGPRVALGVVTEAGLVGVGHAQHLAQRVHVDVAVALHALVTGQELGRQHDRR